MSLPNCCNDYQRFSEELIDKIMIESLGVHQVFKFASVLAAEVVADGIQQYQTTVRYSDSLVKQSLEQTTKLIDNQLPFFTSNLLNGIFDEALDGPSLKRNSDKKEIIEKYANQLSDRVIRSVLPHFDASSYENFSENLAFDICNNAIKNAAAAPKHSFSVKDFSSNLIEKCFQFAFNEGLNHLSTNRGGQQQLNNDREDKSPDSEAVYYRVKHDDDRRLSASSCLSNYSYRPLNSRKNSGVITFSNAATPTSTCNESFMRGLYSFADQLLHSLSTLETSDNNIVAEPAAALFPLEEAATIAANRRSARSDSCPALPNHQQYIDMVGRGSRRKLSDAGTTSSYYSRSIPSYAVGLAESILSEVNINH